jgi:hypothetical protein
MGTPMSRNLTRRLATLAAAAWLVLAPARAEAQRALVYCPVGIDATGCNAIVAALSSSTLFPDGVDAGYDGSGGTVDLAGDLSGYAVFVVPSDDRGSAAGRVHGTGGRVVRDAGYRVDQSRGEGQPDPEPGGMGEGRREWDAWAGGGSAAGQLG